MEISPLAPADLDVVRQLEAEVRDVDGLRLKLEWGMLESGRAGGVVARHGGRAVGMLGVYPFGSTQVELTGMVAPGLRRRGLATRLLAAAEASLDAAVVLALLIVPRNGTGGQALARARGLALDHSEHSMRLSERPTQAPDLRSGLELVQATGDHVDALSSLLDDGFGGPPPPGLLTQLDGERAHTLMVLDHGRPIGTIRLALEGTHGGVYGFTIDPALRGRGIGAEVLTAACHRLLDRGATEIRLEVAVENDRALGLYTRTGFAIVGTEDYYRLPVSSSADMTL